MVVESGSSCQRLSVTTLTEGTGWRLIVDLQEGSMSTGSPGRAQLCSTSSVRRGCAGEWGPERPEGPSLLTVRDRAKQGS
jgi:hypothetical protein